MNVVTLVALGRVAVGAAFGLAPRRLLGLQLRAGAPSDEAVMVLRMLAARDVVLGLGTLAARGDPRALRPWVVASTAADAADAASFAATRALRPLARAASLAVAAGAALLQAGELRVLGR